MKHITILCALIAPSTCMGAVVTTTGQIQQVVAPASVEPGALESDSVAFLFLEQDGITTSAALPLDASLPGMYRDFDDFNDSTLPLGSVVSSYYIHVDPESSQGAGQFFFGTITFDVPILGVIGRSTSLDSTDTLLGSPATTYPSDPAIRRFDYSPLGSTDNFVISTDRRTLTIDVQALPDIDQIRVVVVPGAATGIPLALFACLGNRRRHP